MRGRPWAGLTITMAALVAADACGDSSGPEPASVVGYYLLQTINDQALPCQPSVGDPPIVGAPIITSGALTLAADGTCSWAESSKESYPPFEQSFGSESGTYTRTGDTVRLVFPLKTMSLTFTDGNTLTWTSGTGSGTLVYVYRK
jgi:hypothetical protein